jgi:hypothetical protein
MQPPYLLEPVLWFIAVGLFFFLGLFFFRRNLRSEKEGRAFFNGTKQLYGAETPESTARAVEEPEEIEQLKEEIVKLKYVIVILLAFLALEFMIILWLL